MNVAVVGASGAVGQELLKILAERNFPIDTLRLFGSLRSAGREYEYRGAKIKVEELQHGDQFRNIDIAFVSAGASTSLAYAEDITRFGAVMIDNSSAFRMENDVPLVVPEVNAADIANRPRNIIANPNCTTIQLVVALQAIEKLSHIKRVHVATYQAASGAGAQAMLELQEQQKQVLAGDEVKVSKFPFQLANNMIPQVDVFVENSYTKEEMKMYNETQKIMHSDIKVSATCVRVPSLRAHSEAVWVETEDALKMQDIISAFEEAEGCVVLNDISSKTTPYPMPLFAAGKDAVFIGRIRKDLCDDKGLSFWCVSDQIRRGAALNAVLIAEKIIGEKANS